MNSLFFVLGFTVGIFFCIFVIKIVENKSKYSNEKITVVNPFTGQTLKNEQAVIVDPKTLADLIDENYEYTTDK